VVSEPIFELDRGDPPVEPPCTQRWEPGLEAELHALYAPTRRFAAIVARADADPDDIVQEAFTRVLLVDRTRIDDLGRYVRRIVVNLVHNERRRTRRGATAVARLGSDVDALDRYPSELADLLRLEPRVRALLYLVDVEREPIADAAAVLGLSAPAARMALTRARRRLKSELQGELR
jgi:DNA-directed RNA polymerase specialized sigma24 family protein